MKFINISAANVVLCVLLMVPTPYAIAGEQLNSDFRIAAGMGQLERVQDLLKQGAEINSPGPSTSRVPGGVTALMLAATRNHLPVVKLLIEKGANINQSDNGGGTALIYATWKGNKDVVAYLLEKGADCNAKTRDGRSPLSVAEKYKQPEVLRLLKTTCNK